MTSLLKTRLIAVAMFAANFANTAAACGPELPEKYLSFFSTQFIGYAPLQESLRVRRFIQDADNLPEGLRDANNNIRNPYWANPRDRANLLEWKAYLETNNIDRILDFDNYHDALSYVVYQFDPVALGNIHDYVKGRQYDPLPESIRNTFKPLQLDEARYFLYSVDSIFVAISKQKEIVEYLQFAKACEVRAFDQSNDDGWGEREPFDPAAMRELIDEGKARYAACSSEWVKMRYAYQVVRLARYLREFDEVVALYDELVAPLQVESIVRTWALEHKTASLCFLGRAAEASPLVAQVFEDAPELRRTAYYCFDKDALANDTLAASPHDKAMLWTIAARRRGDRLSFEPLRRVYALAPQSALVESLLIRALLDYEEAEFSRHLEKPDDFALDTAYLAEFEQFVLDAATQKHARRPALWLLAAGYLRLMRAFADHGYAEAAKLLQQAEDAAENDAQVRHQARLLRHVVKLYQPGRINSTFTASFYPELQWLADQRETVIFQTVMTALGQKFLLQGDVPQAACCFYAANNNYWPSGTDLLEMRSMGNLVLDMYADAKDAERLLKFMNQPSFSAFDSFLLRYLPLTQDAALDVWGTHLLRQHEFTRAAAVFDRIAPSYWERDNRCDRNWEGGDFCVKQFETSFFDNAHHESERFIRTNKAEFIRQVLALEQQARHDRARAAEYYWQIANAFYNTSYWGYSGVLWNGSLVWSYKYEYGAAFNRYDDEGNLLKEHGVSYPFNTPALKQAMLKREQAFLQEYGTRAMALEYYQRALKAARNDPELAAETLAMSQDCVVDPTMTSISSHVLPQNTDYFRELHHRYGKTTFYQRLLDECPQFAEYVRSHS
ncbi:hypothetical protein, fragment [Candidatus Moduliflexus flocculans]|uniref:Uncharacterized protein n=1 Tax=Candidatus Moduliflexus flocculans TaxID=1499966 RepID=A0A0S6W494_9BACT|nr:hypothetical protein, fragment [Candidatus Moduliflexus flocculans]